MPLPTDPDTLWPPRGMQLISDTMAEWNAWYVGDPATLRAQYNPDSVRVRQSQRQGGIVGTLARSLWGAPAPQQTDPELQVHVPIASDLAQAAADLLTADPPAITADDKDAQARLEEYEGDGLMSVIAAAAELGGALGGSFLRVTWDPTIRPRCFLTKVDADAGIPEFNLAGQLSAVTLWWTVRAEGAGQVWRHLERHELVNGAGVVLHALYLGTQQKLGARIGLDQDPSTAGLLKITDTTGQVAGIPTPGLLIDYVANARPNRAWRTHPIGQYLGRSDFAGAVIPMMDNLDTIYTAWMRDIRLARARAVIPEYMLQKGAPGAGAFFDADRSIYSALNIPPSANSTIATSMQVIQPAIRFGEHQASAQEWLERILSSAGYSAQTFGENEDGAGVTATEVNSRDRRTALTRGRKIREAQPVLERLLGKMLATDAALGWGGGQADVHVDFPAGNRPTQLDLANTAKALHDAGAASTLTLVKLAQPDLDDLDAQAEADRITAELGAGATVDPSTFTGGDAAGAFPTEGA